MLRAIDYHSCVTLKDFNEYLYSTDGFISEGVPSVNEWTYDNVLRAAHLNVDGSKQGYALFSNFYLQVGDIIEIEIDFLSVSGAKPLIAIDFSTSESFSNFSSADKLRFEENDDFEICTLKHVATKDGYYRVAAGLLTADVGEFYMRDFIIKIQQKKEKKMNLKTVIRKDTTLGWSRRTDFAGDPCSLSTESDGKTLVVTFDESLRGARPLGFVSNEYYIVGNSYMTRCSYVNENSAKIQFFPLSPTPGNTPVNLSDMPNNTHFSLLITL